MFLFSGETKNTGVIFRLLLSLLVFQCVCSEWRPYGQHEYMFSDVETTWSNANMSCVEQNSTLASIADETENEFIIKNTQGTEHEYWLGLRTNNLDCTGCDTLHANNSVCFHASTESDSWHGCCECRREWYWIDGSPMDYMNWQHNDPTGENRCGRMKYGSGTEPVLGVWLWYDRDCGYYESRYICKRETVVQDPTSDDNMINKKPSNDNSNTNQSVFIGVGVGLLVLVIVSIVVIIIVLRRKRKNRNETKHREEHAYYNTAPTTADANHNETQQPVDRYDDVGDAIQNTHSHTYVNNDSHTNNVEIEYEEVNTAVGDPQPVQLYTNTQVVAPEPACYANLELDASSPTTQHEQHSYLSLIDISQPGNIAYQPTSDDYAHLDNVPASSSDTANQYQTLAL